MNYMETGKWDSTVNREAFDKLAKCVLPIYEEGGKNDYAKEAVFFNTTGPNRYTGDEVIIPGTVSHRFFKHICTSSTCYKPN